MGVVGIVGMDATGVVVMVVDVIGTVVTAMDVTGAVVADAVAGMGAITPDFSTV